MTNEHREQARQIVDAHDNDWRGIKGQVPRSGLVQRIAAALSARDAEIKEVLEGLVTYWFDNGIDSTMHWCDPDNNSCTNACLAARDLYAKLNSEAPTPASTTPKRRRKSKRENQRAQSS